MDSFHLKKMICYNAFEVNHIEKRAANKKATRVGHQPMQVAF
jgi:hypothetical protein